MSLKTYLVVLALTSFSIAQAIAGEKRKLASDPQEEQAAVQILEKYEHLFRQIKGVVATDVGTCKTLNLGNHTTDEEKPTICVRVSVKDKSVQNALKTTFGNQWMNLEGTRVEFLLSAGASPQ